MSDQFPKCRALGIEIKLGTQEEADEIGILMFSVPELTLSEEDTQKSKKQGRDVMMKRELKKNSRSRK